MTYSVYHSVCNDVFDQSSGEEDGTEDKRADRDDEDGGKSEDDDEGKEEKREISRVRVPPAGEIDELRVGGGDEEGKEEVCGEHDGGVGAGCVER